MKPHLHDFFKLCTTLQPIITALAQNGGTSFLVGGCVRDLILGVASTDVDIEVHGVSVEQLNRTLSTFGTVHMHGKSFGVITLAHIPVDWSIPRTDSIGRKPVVTLNPHLGITAALRRRDITMNALAINLTDLLTQYDHIQTQAEKNNAITDFITIIDPYNGLDDIAHKRIRAVDTATFIEDPLRLYRVMQFVGRFSMQPDEILNNLCRSMPLIDPVSGKPLAQERITEEIKKLFLQSVRPSRGLAWLISIGRIHDLLPVYNHALAHDATATHIFDTAAHRLDTTAQFMHNHNNQKERFCLMMAALLANQSVTNGHSIATILHPILRDADATQLISCLITNQHIAETLTEQPDASIKKHAWLIRTTTTLEMLITFARCLGSTHAANALFDRATHLGVLTAPEQPIINGSDLLAFIQPGPNLGTVLEATYNYQLNNPQLDRTALLAYAQETIKTKH